MLSTFQAEVNWRSAMSRLIPDDSLVNPFLTQSLPSRRSQLCRYSQPSIVSCSRGIESSPKLLLAIAETGLATLAVLGLTVAA